MKDGKAFFISDDDLVKLIEDINKGLLVIAPQRIRRPDGKGNFIAYTSFGCGVLDIDSRTLLSSKNISFPNNEEILRFRRSDGEVTFESEIKENERVLFGIRNCDLSALNRLDLLFGWDYKDELWFSKRENTIYIVNLCARPLDSKCFCHWVGVNPSGTDSADFAMLKVNGGYLLWMMTDKGKTIIDKVKKNSTKEVDIPEVKSEGFGEALQVEGSHNVLFSIFSNDVWKMLEPACIGCGICTFVCPTCHCFEIQDEGAVRIRFWDYCTGAEFTRASTHQPRPLQYARYRQRILHKFSYYPRRFGTIGCVGCGRCVSECPQNIDIREDIQKLLGIANIDK
ncbi:MAG: 4Fe-4S dicluster domain-containing protein [bacterium]